jgi:hypothetical protein
MDIKVAIFIGPRGTVMEKAQTSTDFEPVELCVSSWPEDPGPIFIIARKDGATVLHKYITEMSGGVSLHIWARSISVWFSRS